MPSNGGSMPREDVAAPADDPDGQTPPAEPGKQPPSDDNNNLSVTLPAPCGQGIREKLLLCVAGVYSL